MRVCGAVLVALVAITANRPSSAFVAKDALIGRSPQQKERSVPVFVLKSDPSSHNADLVDANADPTEAGSNNGVIVGSSINGSSMEEVVAVALEEEEEEEVADDRPQPSKDEVTSLINDLLLSASSSGRGEFASSGEKAAMNGLVSRIEALSPTDGPASTATIKGTWELLYSDTQLFRSSPFFMAGRAVCETPDQAQQYDWFCDMHRAALAISTIGKVRQIISDERMTSEFEVKVGSVPFLPDFTPFAYSGGLPLAIEGAIVSSADITPIDDGKSWEIFMDTVEIKGSNIPLLRQALDAGLKLGSRDLGGFLENTVPTYSDPKPVFATTFLDDSVRISRDQDGKIFVYGKVSDSSEPTNYSGVDSDLGILKLLEGLNDSIFKFYI